MGNCIDSQKSWGAYGDVDNDEEWEFVSQEYKKEVRANAEEVDGTGGAGGDEDMSIRPSKDEDYFDGGNGDGNDGDDDGSSREIRIKISKKQLEKKLHHQQGGVGGPAGGSHLQQLLGELVSLGEVVVVQEQEAGRHWRPALQSIAE